MHPILLTLLFSACAPAPEHSATPDPVEVKPRPMAVADGDAIEHSVRFEQANKHYINVTTTMKNPGDTLMMAVWTPGSYLVREYSRHIEGLEIVDENGELVPFYRLSKNRWKLENQPQTIQVSYRLYCHELSVRTNWVDSDMAILNGASTFLVPVGQLDRAHSITLALPEQWTTAESGLPQDSDGRFIARDFDTLVDSPVIAGKLDVRAFDVKSIPHEIAYLGGDDLWDFDEVTDDVRAITETIGAFWGGALPYDHYTYLNVIAESRGGLEHKNSTLMLASRWQTDTREDYVKWLGLVSHEFFHTWNVKRLRPKALGPFDYETEVYTPSLWIAEGITSYYDDLLLARADLVTQDEYLELISKQFTQLHETPGRLVHPLSATSTDAWIKYYRQDENFKNSSVSYYVKGAVVAFLLDVEIQRATNGARSLDDLMRAAYERFSGETGFQTSDFRELANEIAGTDLGTFFATAVDSAEELDYRPALEWYGLEFETNAPPDEGSNAYLGIEMSGSRIRGLVSPGPCDNADLQVDDELLAINGFRLEGGQLAERLKRYEVGETLTLLLNRRGHIRESTVTLGEPDPTSYTLTPRANATPQQKQRLRQLIERK